MPVAYGGKPMFINHWKKEVLTIPNLLSLFRLLLVPVYVCLYLNAQTSRQYFAAGSIIAVSCLTDAVDGKIARHFHAVTTLGKILDPLADKITQFALTVCLSLKYPVLNPMLALFLGKELIQLTLGAFYLCRGKMLSHALMAGKICTTVLFTSLIALVLFPGIPDVAVKAIAIGDSVFLLISFVSYLLAYFGRTPKVTDLDNH